MREVEEVFFSFSFFFNKFLELEFFLSKVAKIVHSCHVSYPPTISPIIDIYISHN